MADIPHINTSSLDWALKHIEKYGDTDIFPIPFEFEAIRFNWNNIKESIIKEPITNFNINSHRRSLTPKNLFGLAFP